PDFVRDARPFLSDQFDYRPEAVEKHVKGGGKSGGPARVASRMRALREALSRVEPFSEAATEAALRSLAESNGDKPAEYIHPLRVALVGTAVSPSIFTVLSLIGRDRALQRLDRLVRFVEALPRS